ncbi:SusC/RagA family TonB-linked outer membrane protein [Kaistella palustris]|uniref:SusC/RagA family TonB-linked outer membrane protein n=1 Tax=Kaistella palustris TaxID=493376 RepID=UPI0004271439|nr:SusC/RagA family TonB-linked outer membrane protein [Kaistella palustris]
MKKLTTSVLAVVLTSSFALVNAQKRDTARTQNIDEVIVTGALGIKRTADATTSAQQVVSADELNQASNPNAVQALSGKVAGLQINLNNSSVNSSSSIQLRGMRTISGSNEALIVIDNVISTATVLASLPPDIIESINVIKGAQGAALYGADGVNGVVIVSTKKGAKNKLSVTYDGSVDFESVAFTPKRQSKYGQGWDKARDQYENGAWGPAFDGSATVYGLPMYDYNGDGTISLNGIGWGDDEFSGDNLAAIQGAYIARPDEIKKFFQTGTTFSNGITINAGDEGKYALFNVNNTRRDFVIDGDKSNKTSVLFKGGTKLGKFSFDGGFNYIRTDFSQTTLMYDETTNDALYWSLLQSAPDIPITSYQNYPDNAFAWNIYYQNPYWRMKHVREDYTRNYFSANLGTGYDINDHINVRYTGNLQQTNTNSMRHRDAFSTAKYSGAAGSSVKSIASALFLDNRDYTDYYGDILLNFDYDLTSDLNLKLNVGHNYQEHRLQIMQNGGSNLAVPGVYVMTNVTKPLAAGSTSLTNGTYRKNSQAVFANLDLAYKNYLFLNATGRNEWSSVLPKAHNSYFYPSVGLSFVPTKAFDFGGDILNYLKVSGNYTRVGNSSVIDWYLINRTSELVAGFPLNGVNSYRNGMVQTDPNIRPEFVTTGEVNLDLGFLRDRIRLNGSVYQQDTKDLITKQTASSASGINQKLINIAKMRSKGAEINLNLTPFKSADFKWELNAGYAYNESIVLDIMEGVDEISLVSGSKWGIYAQKGSIFPLIKTSMMQRDPAGRIIIDPATGNPLITATLENAGSAVPKSTYSFNTNISYKGLRLSAVADYRYGAKFIADVIDGLAFGGTLYESGEVDRENGGYIIPNSVIPDGNGGYTPNTTVKTGGDTYSSVISYFSGKYSSYGENVLVDGQAFKLREVSLSYTLPKDQTKAFGVDEITFGTYARNPLQKFADNNLDYADPETSYYSGSTNNARGIASRTQYPSTKVYGFSLNVKF